MKRRRHSQEFKKEAVRYMIMEGESATSVSERLGINTNLLYRWKGEFLEELQGAGFGDGPGGLLGFRPLSVSIHRGSRQKRIQFG